MTKSLLAFCFLFSLVFSILTPTVSDILNLGYDDVVLIDAAEEESQKEVETNIDEDILIIKLSAKLSYYHTEEDSSMFKFYRDDSSMYISIVHLPPPELIY
jgi:SpoU rRNA methylase family enzyme